ncbi:ArsR/SmtB family transcription factor [Dyadobacter psychrotolerans]|uniref:Metalloregulator ArsR/SmtB family transcription factor n=1 Tax=Dyadobacter psychrotolerans TaxID=2541721 RepID=A0A4R5DBI0_9BACT|nr:metalloregulator ArsR/SmtB family transcription factor [Dyadobacter psychrotolerans]TDE09350.1 metalloregulator ArsR/SmtB family transcription factor [Dyadobacter psychrotolerans]
MQKQEFKDRIYSELATLTKAMANPYRLQIIELLAQGSRTVEEIAGQLTLSIANASQHLQVLKGANMVSLQKEGHYAHYRLANEDIYAVWQSLRDLGINRMAEIDRTLREFREEKSSFQAISIDELLQKIDQDNVLILDVRPEKEYKAGHIPQALSVPIDQLAQRIVDCPAGQEVIVYCRGPFCVFADEAVELLRERGITASRLDEGFPDWKRRQLPISVPL